MLLFFLKESGALIAHNVSGTCMWSMLVFFSVTCQLQKLLIFYIIYGNNLFKLFFIHTSYYLRQWNEVNWKRLWDWSICPSLCVSVCLCTRIGGDMHSNKHLLDNFFSQHTQWILRNKTNNKNAVRVCLTGFLQVFCSKIPFSSHWMTISLTLSKQ